MSSMTDKMSQAGASKNTQTPKKGEKYRCSQCGMEVQVTSDCRCNNPDHVHFQCCGEKLQKA